MADDQDEFDLVDESVLLSAAELQSGNLTMKQAVAWILRDVEDVPRQEAADQMGISASALDQHLGAARRKIREAKKTMGYANLVKRRHDE